MKMKKSTFKGIVIALIVLALIAVAVGVVALIKNLNAEDNTEITKISAPEPEYGDEELGIDARVDEQLKEYRNIIIFGLDAETKWDSEGHRSDAIVIVSTNKTTNDVKMFSIYRDTLLDIGYDEDGTEYGLDKINHAYAWGGMDQAIRAVNRNLDLNAREAITITWDVVSTVVDRVGGVEIDIESSEYSYLNASLPSDNKIKGTGTQTLNGEQAVMYSRIRKDSSKGDHRRNERLKTVLIAAMEKSKDLETSERITIADDVLKMIDSNMVNMDITNLMIDINKYDVTSSIGWPYKTSGWAGSKISYGVPVTLKSNVIKLHEEMFGQQGYEPTTFVLDTSGKISSKTGLE